MEEAFRFIRAVLAISANLWRIIRTGKASTRGAMEKYTMESGTWGWRTVLAYGKESWGTRTLGSGEIRKLKAMACISGRMEIGMRASGLKVSNMGKEQTFSPMGTSFRETMKRVDPKASELTNGARRPPIPATSIRVSKVATEGGRKTRGRIVTSMMANFWMIWNMDRALSNGKVAIHILAVTNLTCVKAMEKCAGLTAPCIAASGIRGNSMGREDWSCPMVESKMACSETTVFKGNKPQDKPSNKLNSFLWLYLKLAKSIKKYWEYLPLYLCYLKETLKAKTKRLGIVWKRPMRRKMQEKTRKNEPVSFQIIRASSLKKVRFTSSTLGITFRLKMYPLTPNKLSISSIRYTLMITTASNRQ